MSLHSLMYQLAHNVDDKQEKERITQLPCCVGVSSIRSGGRALTPVPELDGRFETGFKPLNNEEEIKQWEPTIRKELDPIRKDPSYAAMKLPRWSSSHERH